MDEARRYIRYVIPGIAFIIQIFLFLWISDPTWINKCIFNAFSGSPQSAVAFAAIILILSVGIGFLLGIIHHLLYTFCGHVDQTALIGQLNKNKIINFKDSCNNKSLDHSWRPRDAAEAWVIITALWHERMKTNKIISGANKRIDSLADINHSNGTARVASFSAWLFTLIIIFNNFKPCSNSDLVIERFVIMNIVALVFVVMQHCSYMRTCDALKKVVHEILFNALTDEKRKLKKTITVYISPHQR